MMTARGWLRVRFGLCRPTTGLRGGDKNMKKFLLAMVAIAGLLVGLPVEAKKPVIDQLKMVPERTVVLNGAITQSKTDVVIQKLLELDKEPDDVFLIIKSPGGSIPAGFQLIAAMTALESDVVCVVDSYAYSMAAVLTQWCHKSYIQLYADMMFHPASFGIEGNEFVVHSRAKHIRRYLNRLHLNVARRLKLSRKDYYNKIRNEWWLTSDMASKQGVVDGVVESLIYEFEVSNSIFVFESSLIWCGPTADKQDPCFGKYHGKHGK